LIFVRRLNLAALAENRQGRVKMTKRKLNVLLATASTAALVGGLSPTAPASAQTGIVVLAGGVSGQVRFEIENRNAAGATVRIPELNLETTTGNDGRYRFTNVPAGEYTLEVDFLGSASTSRTITVPETDDISVDIALAVDEIIVTGRRGALATARAQERAADQIKSIITADDIGNLADQNVAESLQRIPGVTINRSEGEGRQPAIRGLADGFVTVTVDGAQLGSRASAGGTDEGRSVDLDVISSDLLGGIEVTKSLTPDLDADAIGGNVNLRTLSAFDIGKDSLQLRAEGGYQEKADAFNPKVSGSFSKLFADNTFGVTGGASWQQREGFVDDFRTDDGIRSTFLDGPTEPNDLIEEIDDPAEGDNFGEDDETITPPPGILTPNRIDQRADPNERTRLSANLGAEWRPTDNFKLFARGTYARFEDDDVRQRERFELNDGDDEEIIELGPNSGLIADVDIEKRFRFTEQVDDLFTISAGGEYVQDAWTFSGQFDYSKNDSEAPSLEARFRERDVFVAYSNLGIDGVDFQALPNADDPDDDPNVPENFDFRFLTAYDFFSEDEILSVRGDIQRDFAFNERPAFIKIGGKFTERNRMTDINAFRVESEDDLTLDDFSLLPDGPENTDLNFGFTPELGALQSFINDLAVTGDIENPLSDQIRSTARDNDLSEKIFAGYFMTDFQLSDTLKIIAGVRVEHTEYDGVGFQVEQVSYDEDVTDVLLSAFDDAITNGTATYTEDEAVAFLGDRLEPGTTTLDDGALVEDVLRAFNEVSAANSYTDVFPNFNLRWEPHSDIVVRFAFTQAIKRPEFGEISPNALFTFNEQIDADDVADFINDTLGGAVNSLADADAALLFAAQEEGSVANPVFFENAAGNDTEPLRDPRLNPQKANNFDLTAAWYPNDDTFFQVGVFYKDISDFIGRINITDENISILGLQQNTSGTIDGGFDEGVTFINGDAEVYGIEIAYAQNYTFLPAPFNGLFFAGNATIAESDAEIPFTDRDFRLPEQADFVGNMSVGYEDSDFSIRWSGNYVGERLRELNAGLLGLDFDEGDEIERSRFSMDVNLRYNVADGIQLYFDAINLNDAEDRRFFRGGGITGPLYSQIENYGRTFQIGVKAKF
jgi:TonB-dependent receptor